MSKQLSLRERAAPLAELLHRTHALPIALFIILTLVFTYPLVLNLSGSALAWADVRKQVWAIWYRKYTLLHGLPYDRLWLSQAPFTTDNIKWFFRPGYTLICALIAIPLGEITAYNLSILVGIALSGIVTYFLVVRLSGSRLAGFISGAIYAFAPFSWQHARLHGGLTQKWVLPLLIFTLFNLRGKQRIGAAILLGIAFVAAVDVHGYYAFFALITALTFALVEAVVMWRSRGWSAVFDMKRLRWYALAALVAIIAYSPVLIPALDAYYGGGVESPLRSPIALERADRWFYWMSSRPWTFLIPPEYHPIFGQWSQNFYTNLSASDNQPGWFWGSSLTTDMYLGYAALLLALYAILMGPRLRSMDSESGSGLPRMHWVFFVTLLIVAFLFSFPPYFPIGALIQPQEGSDLHEFAIPMPSLLTQRYFPPLRGPAFFVALMLVPLAGLAGLAVQDISRRISAPAARWGFMGLVIALLALEYAHPPSIQTYTIPEEFKWLANQPDGTLVAILPYGLARDAIYQINHEQPTLGRMSEDPLEDNLFFIEEAVLKSLRADDFAPKLAAMSVEYVIDRSEKPTKRELSGLTEILTTETARVYVVDAQPAPLIILHTLEFGFWRSDAEWIWSGEQFSFYVWNTLNDFQSVEIEVIADAEPGVTLEAIRTLTPVPAQVIWSGVPTRSPVFDHPYPGGSIRAEEIAPGRFMFSEFILKKGETTIMLTWLGITGNNYPEVIKLNMHYDGPTAP
jgi:hypothetical protein